MLRRLFTRQPLAELETRVRELEAANGEQARQIAELTEDLEASDAQRQEAEKARDSYKADLNRLTHSFGETCAQRQAAVDRAERAEAELRRKVVELSDATAANEAAAKELDGLRLRVGDQQARIVVLTAITRRLGGAADNRQAAIQEAARTVTAAMARLNTVVGE